MQKKVNTAAASEQNEQSVGGKRNRFKRSGANKTDTTICRWQQDYGITREVLDQLFDQRRDDAAKTLGVCPSTLKRACRKLGISRWRKRPNSALNQKQVAVKKHKGAPALLPAELEATTPTIIVQGNSTMSAKVTYKEHTIRFPLPSSSTMLWLEEELESKFKISIQNFYIKYKDEEDEWITLMCDSGLMHGMNVLRSSGQTIIRMKVDPKSQNLPSPAQQAQPPPNCVLGPTGSGKGVSQILERPNTAEEYSDQQEGWWFNMHNLQGEIRMNSSLPKDQTLGTSLVFEPGSLGGMAQQNWGSRHPQSQTNGHHSVNQMPIDMMQASSPRMMMNYSVPSHDSVGSFDPDCLLLDNEESGAMVIESRNLEEEEEEWRRIRLSINVSFLLRPEFQFQSMAVKLSNKKELWGPTRKPAQDFRLPPLEKLPTLSGSLYLKLYAEWWSPLKEKYPKFIPLKKLYHPIFSGEVFRNNKELPDIVERVLLYLREIKNHRVGISLEAECRGGMIQQQQKSSSEGQIPESSCAAIIGETNVGVGLNRLIDAKGNSSSSSSSCSKTKDTISRWQKDNGITREVLQLLFDKSRGDDSKIHTLVHIHSREHVESLAQALDPQISREKAPIPHSAKMNMYKLLRSMPCSATSTTPRLYRHVHKGYAC